MRTNRSTATAPAPVTPASAPVNVRATSITDSAVRLGWQDTANTEAYFEIGGKRLSQTEWTTVSVPANSQNWTHTGLGYGTHYVYRVRACTATGACSAWVETGATTIGR